LTPAFNNISKNVSQHNQIHLLEEESIKISLKNLFDFPNIKELVENKSLSVHGLIHDIGSGKLKYLNPITEQFEII
jgi:carbonic anhydrase